VVVYGLIMGAQKTCVLIGLFVQKVLDVSLGSIFNTSRRAYVIK
jgi:hypothetical protein